MESPPDTGIAAGPTCHSCGVKAEDKTILGALPPVTAPVLAARTCLCYGNEFQLLDGSGCRRVGCLVGAGAHVFAALTTLSCPPGKLTRAGGTKRAHSSRSWEQSGTSDGRGASCPVTQLHEAIPVLYVELK